MDENLPVLPDEVPPPAVEDLPVLVATLITEAQGLRTDLRSGLRHATIVRNITTALTGTAIAGLIVLGLVIMHDQSAQERRSSCTAVNSTNSTLLRLLDSATAQTPTEPPVGSTAAQVEEFRAQQARGAAFTAQAHRDLAPQDC